MANILKVALMWFLPTLSSHVAVTLMQHCSAQVIVRLISFIFGLQMKMTTEDGLQG